MLHRIRALYWKMAKYSIMLRKFCWPKTSNIDSLVPFPQFELDFRAELRTCFEKLGLIWTSPNWQGHLNYFDFWHWLTRRKRSYPCSARACRSAQLYFGVFEWKPRHGESFSSTKGRAYGNDGARISRLIRFWNSLRKWILWNHSNFGSCHNRAKPKAANFQKLAVQVSSVQQNCRMFVHLIFKKPEW